MPKFLRGLVAAIFLVCCVGVLSAPSHAIPVTLDYIGVIDSASAGPQAQALVGETITITYTYESGTGDLDLSPSLGHYPLAATGAIVRVAGFTWTLDYGAFPTLFMGVISVTSNSLGGLDAYGFAAPLSGPALDIGAGPTLGISLVSPGAFGSLVPDDDLPLTAPDPRDFLTRTATLSFSGGVFLTASAIVATAPPMPPLMAAALALAGMLKRRSRIRP